MLVDPLLEEVVKGPRGMILGIEACVECECLVSAVTLIFAAIDALAALTRPTTQPETDGEIFRAWATRYINPAVRLHCSAQDLWGARCGVLHTYSPEATRAAKLGARRVYYEWRQGPPADAVRTLPADAIVLIVENLYEALVDAANAYMHDIAADAQLALRVNVHLASLLCYEPYIPLVAETSM
ncbi:MAG: hypothetical protein KGO02_16775 [Alphaproteobacteria bacterium]|nr:hypothetical protein [Alphaproteobacteria bacterium]